jgi:XTP/dITP diphosphohydrolase
MRILFGTNNEHKLRELRGIMREHTVFSLSDLDIATDVEETGATFLENALIKAQAFARLIDSQHAGDLVVVADDSGLCVDALGGGPGIYSARYGSDGASGPLDSASRNGLLLDKMRGVENRDAHFSCCMVALIDGDRLAVAQEQWMGRISLQPSAAPGGFGYDPVFYLPDLGCTAADLPAEQKNQISHRARAARVLLAALEAAASLPDGPEVL